MPVNISAENIWYGYGDQHVLRDVTLVVEPGESVIITGRSGSGKSTLLEICAGLIGPHQGVVKWNDKDIRDYGHYELVDARRRTGFVFQLHALIANYSIFENIALPLRYHTTLSDTQIRGIVGRHVEKLGLANIASKRPEQLSIGQARWAAIARALVVEPDVLFLDEPTSGLDPVTAHTIIHTIRNLQKKNHLSIIMISHIMSIIRQMDCRVMRLEEGELMQAAGSSGGAGNSNEHHLHMEPGQ